MYVHVQDQRLDKKHVQTRYKLSRHGRMFWGAFAWRIRTQLFELVRDEFSDRKGVTGATIRSSLSEALPTIAEPGMVF